MPVLLVHKHYKTKRQATGAFSTEMIKQRGTIYVVRPARRITCYLPALPAFEEGESHVS